MHSYRKSKLVSATFVFLAHCVFVSLFTFDCGSRIEDATLQQDSGSDSTEVSVSKDANNQDVRDTDSTPRFCGGIVGLTCKNDEYCDFNDNQSCGIADAQGQCKPKPTVCTTDFDPVCGCDNKQYSNACSAASAGFDVKQKGNCP